MPGTLHMDVDSCRSTQSQIQTVHDQIEQQMSSIRTGVDGMVGSTWIAPGATQFQNNIHDWANSVTQLLTNLNDLSSYLQKEIAEWEAAAAN